MSDLNNLLAQGGLNISQERQSDLKSQLQSQLQNKLTDIQGKIEDATGLQDIGGLLIGAPDVIKTTYSSGQKLLETGKNVNDRIDNIINNNKNKLNNISDNVNQSINNQVKNNITDEGGELNESQKSILNELRNRPVEGKLSAKPKYDPNEWDSISKSNNIDFQNVRGTLNNNLSHVNNADLLNQPEGNINSSILDSGVSDIKSGLEKTGKSVLSGLTEGLDLGALSEDFVNPVLDLAAIGSGIGSLISGISKKKKEQKELEETQKQGIGNINISPTQLTAASTTNPSQIIGQSATQSF